MFLRIGIPLTHRQLVEHLVAHDPAYKQELEKLLESLGWSLETYYSHVEDWDFYVCAKDLSTRQKLQDMASRPSSTLLTLGGDDQLYFYEDKHNETYLSFPVMTMDDDKLTNSELATDYEYAVEIFAKAKLPIDKLTWFLNDE